MRTAYLECFSGISGDMMLGALVDAGVPFARLEETAAALNVGARLEMRKVSRGGIAGTKVDVLVGEGQGADHAHTLEVEAAHSHTHAQHSHGSEDAHSHTHTHTHAHTREGDHEHPHDHAIAGEHS